MITEKRNLKYRINWKDAREGILRERIGGAKLRFDPDIKAKSASDFSKRVKEGESVWQEDHRGLCRLPRSLHGGA